MAAFVGAFHPPACSTRLDTARKTITPSQTSPTYWSKSYGISNAIPKTVRMIACLCAQNRQVSRLVRIFNHQLEEIRVHVEQPTKGRFSTHPADIAPEKISGIERVAEWLLQRASAIGDHADRWAQEVIHSRGIEGIRAVIGLLSLADRQPRQLIDQACEIANSYVRIS